jgi:hypothetical protein
MTNKEKYFLVKQAQTPGIAGGKKDDWSFDNLWNKHHGLGLGILGGGLAGLAGMGSKGGGKGLGMMAMIGLPILGWLYDNYRTTAAEDPNGQGRWLPDSWTGYKPEGSYTEPDPTAPVDPTEPAPVEPAAPATEGASEPPDGTEIGHHGTHTAPEEPVAPVAPVDPYEPPINPDGSNPEDPDLLTPPEKPLPVKPNVDTPIPPGSIVKD